MDSPASALIEPPLIVVPSDAVMKFGRADLLSLEIASGIALVLWIITFVTIVPLGLALAFHEGIKFRNLRHLDSAVPESK